MPTYDISAPDGKVFTIEGDREPTQEEMAQIYSAYQKQNTTTEQTTSTDNSAKPQMSAAQTAVEAGRAATSGMAFGLGPIIAGISNVTTRKAAAITAAIADKSTAPLKEVFSKTDTQLFEEGRKEFIKGQQQLQEQHPIIAGGATLAGSIPTFLAGGAAASKGIMATAQALNTGQKIGKTAAIVEKAAKLSEVAAPWSAEEAGAALSNGENGIDPAAAVKAGAKGAAEGALFGYLTGVINPLVNPIVAKAADITGIKGTVTRALAGTITPVTDAAAISAGQALIEGKIPTNKEELEQSAKEFGENAATFAALKGGAAAFGAGLSGAREYLLNPTPETIEREKAAMQNAAKKTAPTKDESQSNADIINDIYNKYTQIPQETVKTDIATLKKKYPDFNDSQIEDIRKTEFTNAALEDYKQAEEPAPLTFREKMQQGFENLLTNFDLERPLKAEEAKAERLGIDVPENEKPSNLLALKRQGGLTAEALTGRGITNPVTLEAADTADNFKSILNDINKIDPTDNKIMFDKYARARTMIDRIEGRAQNDKEPLNFTDEQVSDMRNTISNFKDEFEPIFQKFKNYEKQLVDLGIDSGLYNKETIEKFRKLNPDYTMTQAALEGEKARLGQMAARGDISQDRLKEVTGALQYRNTLDSAVSLTNSTINEGLVNKAKQKYIDMAIKTGDAKLARFNHITTPEGIRSVQGSLNPLNQIQVFDNGKAKIYDVPPNVARAFNPVYTSRGLFEKTIGRAALAQMRIFKGATTAASQGFSAMNILRDAQNIMWLSKYGATLSDYANVFKDMMEGKFGKDSWFKDFEMQSGHTLQSVEFYKRPSELSSATKSMFDKQPLMQKISNGAEKTLEAISFIPNLSERAGRATIYRSVLMRKIEESKIALSEKQKLIADLRKVPASWKAEAGKESRNVTLDFSRPMTPSVEYINRYFIPYFKPGILGTMRMSEVLSNPEIAPRAWRYITNVGILQALAVKGMLTQQEKEDFNNINDEIKAKNFTTILTPSTEDKLGKYAAVPLAQETAGLTKLFSLATEKMLGDMPPRSAAQLKKEALEALNQTFSNATPLGNGGLTNLIPSQIKPFVELYANKNFFTGAPIMSKRLQQLKNVDQYTAATPRVIVAIYKKLYNISGGLINFSPLKTDYILKGYGTNAYKESIAGADALFSSIYGKQWGKEKDLAEYPIVSRFIKNLGTPYDQNALDYENKMADYEKAAKSYEIRLQRGDNLTPTQEDKYLTATKIYDMLKSTNQDLFEVGKDMSDARKWFEANQDNANDDLKNKRITKAEYEKIKKQTEADYTEMLNKFVKRQSDIYNSGLKIMKEQEEEGK
jgi:hypothetical protein